MTIHEHLHDTRTVRAGRILDSRHSKTCYGAPYIRLILRIDDRALKAYLWNDVRKSRLFPKGLDVIVDARLRSWGNEPVLDVFELVPEILSVSKRDPRCVEALPNWLVDVAPHPSDVRRLWVLVHLLRDDLLRWFVCRVFHDPEIAVPFVQDPASRQHHHSCPGGLLRHSVESMSTWAGFPGIPGRELEVARVAGLFHDVGKILMAYGETKRPVEAILSEHEDATFEVLAPHLKWLRMRDADLVAALKCHLGRNSRMSRPWMPSVISVHMGDQLSTAVDVRRQAFTDAPSWQRYARRDAGGPIDRFWRMEGPSGAERA